MELRQVYYFLRLCKDRNFSIAAEHSFITQQGLSMSMQRLETEFGCRLFNRNGKHLTLTEEGEWFLNRAEKIDSLAMECRHHFEDVSNRVSNINVVANSSFFAYAPKGVADLLQGKDPQFRVSLSFKSGIDAEDALDEGLFDLGIICGPIDTNKYTSQLVMQREYAYVVNKNHPYANCSSLSIKQFEGQPLIFPGPSSKIYHEFRDLCVQHGFMPNYSIELNSQATIIGIVNRSSEYIGQVMLDTVNMLNVDSVKVLKLGDCDLSWRAYLVWKNDHILTSTEKAFIKQIMEGIELS